MNAPNVHIAMGRGGEEASGGGRKDAHPCHCIIWVLLSKTYFTCVCIKNTSVK